MNVNNKMKRVSTWLTTICIMVLGHANLFAASVDSTKAKQLALDFFSTITKTTSEQLLAEGVSIAYCAYADEFAEPQANTVCFYVVNVGRNGFVMLSGDNRLKPILGYSYESSFSTENMPENLRDWLDVKRREISSALMSETLFASSEIIYQWNHLSEIGATMSVVVQPLLQTEWDQNSYYNQHCPVDANGPNGHAYAGCVATAMAQIIRYWEWPWAGFDSHNYTCNYGNLSVDFSSAYYNYNNMPYSINGSSNNTQIDAVAMLIYHCGVSVDMNYGSEGSEASSYDAYSALINYFAYPPGISYQSKSNYSSTEWNNMLRDELNNSRPILYSGQGTGGHAFVCDGYDNNGTYHFNWGWSGYFNGYFALNALTPTTGHNYSDEQTAIFGINADGSFIRCSSNNLSFSASIGGSGVTMAVDVRGHSLNGNINVMAGNGFTVGTDNNSFSNSVTMPAQGGRLYVKYTPTLSSPGNQNANVILVSGSARDTVFCYGSAFDEVCLPPQNLTGTHTGSQVQLSWSEPVNYGSGPDVVNISWDSTVSTYTFSYGSNMTICMMQRFDVNDLTPYHHYLLKSISFIPAAQGTSFRLVVYKGGYYNNGYHPGTQIVNQEIPAASLVRDTWNTVPLNTPVLVDASEELWFGFVVYTTGTDGYVIPVSTGNYVANKGCVCGVSGGHNDGTGYFYWTDFSDYNVNFPIKGRLEQISANVLRYEVYRNASQIGNTTSTTYTDYSPIFSNSEYTVSAVWDNSCSQSASVTLIPPAVSLPTVTTGSVSNISATTATCGGEVTSSGGSTVTARGVCWSTSQNPTVADSHTSDGSGTGSFNSNITGLTPSTTYYVRAYATNSVGTAYGEPRVLTTSCTTINESFVVTACDSYTWNGTTYTQTGNYIQQFQTAQGCDSVVEMSLTVIPSPQIHLTYLGNVCPGSEEVDFTMQVISTYSEAPCTVQQTSDFDADRNEVLNNPNNPLITQFSKPYTKIEDFLCGNTYHLYYTVTDANGCIVRDTATFTAYDNESPILGGWSGSPLYQRLEPKRGLNCTYNSLSKAEFVMAFLGKAHDNCALYDSAYLYDHSDFYWENSSNFGYTLAYDNLDIFGNNVGNTLTVKAVVWDDCGNVADALAFWFERPVFPVLDSAITIDPNRICLGETAYLYFDSTAVASDPHSEFAHPLSFLWSSPDDDINFSIINSVNTSVAPGTGDKVYHVNMTVSDLYGCTVTSDSEELFVKATPMMKIIPVTEYDLQPPYCPSIGVLHLAAVNAVDSSFVPNLFYTWTSTQSMFVDHGDTTLLYVIPDSCSYIYDKQVFVTDTIYGCTAEASIFIPVLDQAPNYIGEEHFDTAHIESACTMTVTDFTHYVTPSTIDNVCGLGFNQYTIWQEPPVGTIITEETPVCVYISTPCREDTSKILGKFKNIPNANSLQIPVFEVIPNHNYTAPYDGIIRLRGVPRGFTYRLYNNSAELVETQIPAWDAESDTTTVVFDELAGNVTYMVKIISTQGCETIFDVYVPTYSAYIDEKSCPAAPTVTDIDGNLYSTVQVGEQCWMRENMRTTRYADGTAIACSSTGSITTAYRYYPNHDSANVAAYGYLYNWFAVMNYVNSSNLTSGIVQGVCPNGWHVPSDSDWVQLLYYVSSQNNYGCHNNSNNISKAMASTTGWNISSIECATGYNQSSNNATGFSIFPAGCFRIGYQNRIGEAAYLWSTTEYSGNAAYGTYVDFNDTIMRRVINLFKDAGLTVRCLRDNVPCGGSYSSVVIIDTTVCMGSQVTFTSSGDTNTTSYIWYSDGVEITGENEADLTVNFDVAGTYLYVVKAFNNEGCVSVDSILINVSEPPATPQITVDNQVICNGGQITLMVTNPDNNAFYTWYRNGDAISGAVSATITDALVTVDGESSNYEYTVIANLPSSDCTSSQVSSNVIVTVIPPPAVSVSVEGNTTLCEGGSTILHANVTPVNTNYSYQWYKDNVPIEYASLDVCVVTEAARETAYNYSVVVSDLSGCSVTEDAPAITFVTDPDVTIVRLPDLPQTVCDGGNTAIKAIVVGGYGESSYQWFKNGSLLVGETNQILNIYMLSYGVNDIYSVEVTQTGTGCSTVGSTNINSLVTVAPDYTINITGFGNVCEGGSCTLSSTVTGVINDDVLSYQWYRVLDNGNAIAIDGATMAQYTTSDLLLSGSYDYYVVVGSTRSGCSLASSTVSVNVVPNPTIILSADNTIMCVGGVATLTAITNVNNNIPGNFNYKWVADDDTTVCVTEQFSYTLTDPGVHTFKVRAFMDNNSGCVSDWSAPVIIHVAEQPVIVLTSTDSLSLCEGGSITMTAVVTNYSNTINGVTNSDVYGAMTYSWTSNGTPLPYNQAQITTILNNIGVYSYQVNVDPDGHFCQPQASNIQVVNVVGDPSWAEVLVYGSNGSNACLGDIITLEAEIQGGVTDENGSTHGHIQWIVTDSDGNAAIVSGGPGGTSYDIPAVAGTYIYTPTFVGNIGNGCQLTNNNAFQETVTIHELTLTEIAVTACDSYTWNDSTYYISGDYTQTLYNVNNCDSTITIHLTVHHGTHNVQTEVVCDNYTWHGTTYTQSGSYTYDYTNSDGCYSTDTLNLSVVYSDTTDLFVTAFDSYIWNDQTYTESGDYTNYMTNVNGCDSIVILHLTIMVGIDDHELTNAMVLFPNPTNNIVNVRLAINQKSVSSKAEIQLFDIYGKILQTVPVIDEEIQLDLTSYASGVYFVKAVLNGQIMSVRKVIRD